jgi:hypothetical protein
VDPAEAEALLVQAVRLGTFAAVFNNLQRMGAAKAAAAWRAKFRQNHLQNEALEHEETVLLERLNREGIPCRAIKGVRLVRLLYPDLSWRKVRDIDLLVLPEEVEPAYRALKRLGLRDTGPPWTSHALARQVEQPSHAHAEVALLSRYQSLVELHWDWTGESFPQGEPAAEPEPFLLYLCRHAGKHFWSSLQMVSDIELYLRKFAAQMDWPRFWTLARRSGEERSCIASLELCSLLYGRPAEGWPRTRAGRALSREAAGILLEGRRPWWWESKPLRLLRIYSWRQRVSRCWRWLAPPPWHWNRAGEARVSALGVWAARYRRLGFEFLARIAPSQRWRDRMNKAAGLTGAEWRFFTRAWLLLAAVRMALLAVPFERLQRWASQPRGIAPNGGAPARGAVHRAAWLVEAAANHHVLPMLCLPRSLVLVRLLALQGVATELKVGVRLEKQKLLGHAWVEWRGERLNDPYEIVDHYAELKPVVQPGGRK